MISPVPPGPTAGQRTGPPPGASLTGQAPPSRSVGDDRSAAPERDPAGEVRALLTWLVTVAVGAMVLVGGTGVFAKLAHDVSEQDGATRVDRVISGWVTSHRPDRLTDLVAQVTLLAEPAGLLVAAVLLGGLLSWRRGAWAPLFLLVAAAGGCVGLGSTVKFFAERPRPPMAWWAVQETGFSFPSLHTLTATATFGMLAYLAPRGWPPRRRATAWLVALGGAVLIAGTRVYLGVHWPTDVAASFALGAAWLAVLVLAVAFRTAVQVARGGPA